MMLRVVYPDGKYDIVNPLFLASLIKCKSLSRFQRSDGWVDIDDTEHLRNDDIEVDYPGYERRMEIVPVI